MPYPYNTRFFTADRILAVMATALASLFLLFSSACSNKRAEAQKPPLSKCKDELSAIRDARIALQSRKQDEQAPVESIEGLELALTFDGMIASSVDPSADLDDWCYSQNTRENFDKLVAVLKDRGVPPSVAFVTGSRTDTVLAKEWVKNGQLLGNTTFHRRKLVKASVEEFTNDIAENDKLISGLMGHSPPPVRYFRYPDGRSNRDAEKRAAVSGWLKKNGYHEAPATIDARDHRFSQVYCAALARNDQSCANYVKAVFISVLMDRTARSRKVVDGMAGHSARQVLALGANQLICDALGEILDAYRAKGVRFVPLDAALQDPLYSGGDIWETVRMINRATRR
jgi:peptidoglycan/xylan/chitin deacetylase (PgdA/CDA1 family)